MKDRNPGAGAALRSGACALLLLAGTAAPALAGNDPPHVTGGNAVQRGEYLVRIAGCNDCHTPGWAEHPDEIPVAQQLTGTAIGWYGPWGTSFPTNLRLLVAGLSEQQWLHLIKTFHPLPPMPAYNVQHMNLSDKRAIFAYIKSLGPAGIPAPEALPPGRRPPSPVFTLDLPPPPK